MIQEGAKGTYMAAGLGAAGGGVVWMQVVESWLGVVIAGLTVVVLAVRALIEVREWRRGRDKGD